MASNAYTKTPQLHPNLFVKSFQLLAWILFQPTAWRNFIKQIEPNLPPHFSLVEQKRAYWYRPAWRSILQAYFICPLIVWFITLFGLSFVTQLDWPVFIGLFFGVATGLFFGIAVSMAAGLMVMIAATVGFTLLFGTPEILLIDVVFNSNLGVVYGTAVGLAGYTLNTVESQSTNTPLAQRLGGLVIGIFASLFVMAIVFGVPTGLATAWQRGEIGNSVAVLFAGGTPTIIFTLAIGLRTRSWRRGITFGISSGLIITLFVGLLFRNVTFGSHLSGLTLFNSFMIITTAAFLILYILPFVLVERIAGAWAAAIAGLLTSQAIYIMLGLVFIPYKWLPNLIFSLSISVLLFVMAWWRPILFFPFLAAWHTILYRIDAQRDNQSKLVLRWHAAFWDEQQRIPWSGLEDHLILALERNLEEGQQALNFLSQGNQRWAARAAQIEMDARQLEQLADVEAIVGIHQQLSAGELVGPASALLRSFSHISQDMEAALYQVSAFNQRLALKAVANQLNSLIRELTRSDEPYAVRFQPIAVRWREIVATHVEELAATAEQRQEIDNPYIIGVPLIARQEIFVGRANITTRIENLLLDRQRPPLLLYGQRRMGKTSLLNNLGRLLPRHIVPLFVDLQGPVSFASDHAGLFYNLARDMAKSAKRQRGVILPRLPRTAFEADPFTAFDEWLDEVEAALDVTNGHTILLALDEFEALDHALVEGRFSETAVLGSLRHIIQHRPRFKVLLAGSHTLQEFERWASYFINAQIIHLGYLQETEALQLIEQPVKNFKLRYRPNALQQMLALTRGHPFLLQLLCSEVVTLKNEQSPDVRRMATLEDVETAVSEALKIGRLFFADIQNNQIDAVGLKVLRFIAARGKGACIQLDHLHTHLEDNIYFKKSLALLQRRELLESANGGYRFQIEMIRRWFLV